MAEGDRVELAVKATGGVVLAVIAQGLGGPDAALLTPAAQPIVEQLAAYLRRQAEGVERMLDASARKAGIPVDAFGHRVSGTDELAALLAESVEAAYATVGEAKLRALAAVLADGVRDLGRDRRTQVAADPVRRGAARLGEGGRPGRRVSLPGGRGPGGGARPARWAGSDRLDRVRVAGTAP